MRAPGVTTEIFRFATTADAGTVWRALTNPDLSRRYLHGLALESDWRTGSTVTARTAAGLGGAGELRGEVLSNTEPHRLSFTLGIGDGQPETYVTWEIRAIDAGRMVTLSIDEPGSAGGADRDDIEAAWRPVVSGLESLLVRLGAADNAQSSLE